MTLFSRPLMTAYIPGRSHYGAEGVIEIDAVDDSCRLVAAIQPNFSERRLSLSLRTVAPQGESKSSTFERTCRSGSG